MVFTVSSFLFLSVLLFLWLAEAGKYENIVKTAPNVPCHHTASVETWLNMGPHPHIACFDLQPTPTSPPLLEVD